MTAPSNNDEALGRYIDSLPDLVLIVDASMLILDVNHYAATELGWERHDLIGHALPEFSDQSEAALNAELTEQIIAGRTVHFDRRLRTIDGEWRTFNFAARLMDGVEGQFVLAGRQMDALAHSHSQLADLLKLADLTDDMLIVCDEGGFVTYANAAAARVHRAESFIGCHMTEFLHEDDVGYPELLASVSSPEYRGEARVMAKRFDGSPVMFGVRTTYDPQTRRWFTVERDITLVIEKEQAMLSLTADLRRQATTDELTGVANRNALQEALDAAVESSGPFALLLLDMDDFKSVNDTFGHAAGDEFLQCVAQRMQGAVKQTDMVARLGGDEFVVHLPGADAEAAAEVAGRIIKAVGEEYSIGGSSILRSCSIGLAVWEMGETVSEVLRKADRAAYRAKHEGRSRFAM